LKDNAISREAAWLLDREAIALAHGNPFDAARSALRTLRAACSSLSRGFRRRSALTHSSRSLSTEKNQLRRRVLALLYF
jgi:hypothetical protein